MNCFDLKLTEFSALSVGGKNPNLGHYAHYVPTVASTMQYPPKDPIHARFTYQDDGTVQQLVEVRCISCHGVLNQSNWRRDGGTVAQCDSCANYTKMNGTYIRVA